MLQHKNSKPSIGVVHTKIYALITDPKSVFNCHSPLKIFNGIMYLKNNDKITKWGWVNHDMEQRMMRAIILRLLLWDVTWCDVCGWGGDSSAMSCHVCQDVFTVELAFCDLFWAQYLNSTVPPPNYSTIVRWPVATNTCEFIIIHMTDVIA